MRDLYPLVLGEKTGHDQAIATERLLHIVLGKNDGPKLQKGISAICVCSW